MANEIKSINVDPSNEENTVNIWQSFGWVFKSTQDVRTSDAQIIIGQLGDTTYRKTKEGEHYVKLTFERDPKMPNYEELCNLEKEYYAYFNVPEPIQPIQPTQPIQPNKPKPGCVYNILLILLIPLIPLICLLAFFGISMAIEGHKEGINESIGIIIMALVFTIPTIIGIIMKRRRYAKDCAEYEEDCAKYEEDSAKYEENCAKHEKDCTKHEKDCAEWEKKRDEYYKKKPEILDRAKKLLQ